MPTIDEAGVKGDDVGYWFAAYVPAGAPPSVGARRREVLVAGTKSAPAKSFLEGAGVEPWTTMPAEM